MTLVAPPLQGPAYRVCSERLVARCWSPEDAERLRAALDASDAHLRPWIPFMRDEPRSLEETTRWLRRHRAQFDLDEEYRYGVFSRDEEQLLGEAMLLGRSGPGSLEIGYWIDVRHVGHGYATEAAAVMTRVGFEIQNVARVEIHCAPENEGSAAIPRRLGFTHESTLKERLENNDGGFDDLMVWSMFAADYPRSKACETPYEPFDVRGRALT
jgi:RimJ/RimL family protein N-acetyltransferase